MLSNVVMLNEMEIEMSAENREMFGVSNMNEFNKCVEMSITYKIPGIGMVIMSLMSDAQEEMAHGCTEEARQTLNRAKWLIAEYKVGLNGNY